MRPYKILSKWGDFKAGDISKPQLRQMCSELAKEVGEEHAAMLWKDVTEFQRLKQYA